MAESAIGIRRARMVPTRKVRAQVVQIRDGGMPVGTGTDAPPRNGSL
jgi:hypothetical protein